MFTSNEALRWTLLVRNIDVLEGWELRLRDIEKEDIEPNRLSRNGSFSQACKGGDMDIVKAMVERTDVDLETKYVNGRIPLRWAADDGHREIGRLRELGTDQFACL